MSSPRPMFAVSAETLPSRRPRAAATWALATSATWMKSRMQLPSGVG
jgi:hypothetical protein